LKSRSNSILGRRRDAEYNSPRIKQFSWVAESRTYLCDKLPIFMLKKKSSIIDIIVSFSERMLKEGLRLVYLLGALLIRLGYDIRAEAHLSYSYILLEPLLSPDGS
jgi:hypothetical protein